MACLLRANVFKNALRAEEGLPAYRVGRKKLARVISWLDENPDDDLKDVPTEFLPGRTHQGALTAQQKRDLLKHVEIMQRSNVAFTATDIKKSMFRFYLVNLGVVQAGCNPDWSEFEKYEKDRSMHEAHVTSYGEDPFTVPLKGIEYVLGGILL